MENYNLTAELKKIASGITTSDPNTELGNINSGVGNLDTAMQGVATAINGISIPNPGSNIDGVATAIGNISIPNTGSNIDGVATAVDNLAGGKDLGDIETILTTMNGNIANLGTNHIIGLTPTTGGYMVARGGSGGVELLPNEARYTSYTDTNNIGATDVQSAVDFFGAYSDGQATINTAYLSGMLYWQKIGKFVSVFYELQTTANLPGSNWDPWLVADLPAIRVFNNSVRRFTAVSIDPTKPPLTLAATNAGGIYNNNTLYSWGNGGITSGGSYRGSFEYFTF